MRANDWPVRLRMMLPAAVFMLLLAATPSDAQTPKDLNCTGDSSVPPDTQIARCSTAIDAGRYQGKDLADAFGNRGKAFLARGEADRALSDFEQAIRIDPNNAAAFNNRGNAWLAKGEADRALADYNEAIRLEPAAGYGFNGRGNAYKAKGNLAAAFADYEQAARLDPKDAIAANNLGIAYQLLKADSERALTNFNQAIELDPTAGGSTSSRGILRAPSPTMTRRSGSIRRTPRSSTAAATPMW